MINILGIWLVGNVLLAAVKGEGSEAASAKDLIFQFYVSSRPLVDLTPIIPAVDLALELINMDPNVLPGYNFKYLNVVNSYCASTPAVRGFFNEIQKNTTSILIIGPDCTSSSEPIAGLAPHWNLVQIATTSVGPSLSDNLTYPYFLRPVPSGSGVVTGLISTMKFFGWTHLGVITEAVPLFRQTLDEILLQNSKHFDVIANTEFLAFQNPQRSLLEIKESSARIIYLNMYSDYALEILCQAASLEMYPPTYQWMIPYLVVDDFWKQSFSPRTLYTPFTDCSPQQIQRIISGIIVVDHFPRILKEDYNTTSVIGNMTMATFRREYLKRLNDTEVSAVHFDAATYAYDAVWTGALALEEARMQSGINLSEFTYENETIANAIYSAVLKVSFNGTSGRVYYQGNGDRTSDSPDLLQYRMVNQELSRVRFATVKSSALTVVLLPGESVLGTIFPAGKPKDRENMNIASGLFAFYTILAVSGIAYSISCIVFSIVFRNKIIVKLSSPYQNVIIASGAILLFIYIIFIGVDEGASETGFLNVTCQFRLWLLSIGFTLLYAPIMAKAWRVYFIFRNLRVSKTTRKTVSRPWHLVVIILVLLAIDLVFLIIVTSIPETLQRRTQREIQYEDGRIPSIVGSCTSLYPQVWLGVLGAYRGLELLLGLFLAFETRNVKIKELNDSKVISFAVYTIVITTICLLPIGFFVRDVTIAYSVIGLLIMGTITVILSMIFIPKMISLCRDPTGERDLTIRGQSDNSNQTAITQRQMAEILNKLTDEMTQLKMQMCQECLDRVQSEPNTESCILNSDERITQDP